MAIGSEIPEFQIPVPKAFGIRFLIPDSTFRPENTGIRGEYGVT
jgi:hypothetical protein